MTTVLGREVHGEIAKSYKDRKNQKPGEEFLPLLDAVLSQRNVHSVRWTQYTPYFNDGEPCIFGVNEASVKLSNEPNAGEELDGYITSYDMFTYGSSFSKKVIKSEFEKLYPVFHALESEMECFEDFLQESFGDHATVTATSDGFDIEFYDHD